MSRIEQRLNELGTPLPPIPAPVASYVPAVQTGKLVVCSGQLPLVNKALVCAGKVGGDVTEEAAAAAAKVCALNALAAIQGVIGNLDRIQRIVRVEGYVQSAPGFSRQPIVINGASDFLVEVFGEAGKHSRIAVGANELPLNAAVEVAIWVEVS
jgi:enamine deaminase RidA (YjgF/YER057c/UK114 family)